MKKYIAIIMSVMFVVLFATACSTPVDINSSGTDSDTSNSQDFPIIINGVTINSKPDKVVILSSGIADVVLALGYEETLVAVTEDCTQTELSSLPKIQNEDADSIINLSANLVIGRDLSESFVASLTEAGIPAIDVAAATDRSDFERLYSHIATAMNGANTGSTDGTTTAKNIFTTLDDLSRIIPQSDTIKIGVFITDLDGTAIMGNTLVDTVMSYAGVTNAFTGSTDAEFSFEDLRIFDPEYIFCLEGQKDLIESDSRYADLSAVKNGNVYEIKEEYILWEGRTIITLATEIAGIVYPELLEEETSENKVPDITSSADESDIPDVTITVDDLDEMGQETYETLNLEDENDNVYAMQERLFELGYLTATYNGFFGNTTQESLKAFEEKAGLTVDGIADNETLQALFSDDAPAVDDDTSSEDEDTSSEDDTSSEAE
ncbi:MAG: peptidoglycan-binding protein [Clostridia bacterium]